MSSLHKEYDWVGEPLRLDKVLVALGAVPSRGRALELIAASAVSVNGEPVSKQSVRVPSGAKLALLADKSYVSRAAQKLVSGIDLAGIDVNGKIALDVGASTGGFTQVLLERGAARVVALDVGHGQLHESLRSDPRVQVVEGFNARNLDRSSYRELAPGYDPPDIIVSDVSFISLTYLLEAFKSVSGEETTLILLVKPQFEVGKEHIRSGVVTSPELHTKALLKVLTRASEVGFRINSVGVSPVTGTNGNREFLTVLCNTGLPAEHDIETLVAEAVAEGARIDEQR